MSISKLIFKHKDVNFARNFACEMYFCNSKSTMAPIIHALSKGFSFISSDFDLNGEKNKKSVLIKLKVYVIK